MSNTRKDNEMYLDPNGLDGQLWIKTRVDGEPKLIGYVTPKYGEFSVLGHYCDNYDEFIRNNGTYSRERVKWNNGEYSVRLGHFARLDNSFKGSGLIYDFNRALPHSKCHDPNIKRTEHDLVPVIF